MAHDAAVPASLRPPTATVEQRGVFYSSARWTPDTLAWLARHLRTRGQETLEQIPDDAILAAWSDTVEAFLDSGSPERQALDASLQRLCQLSQAGLEAGLQAVLGGVRREVASPLLRQATSWNEEHGKGSLVLVILAANLPALAVQPLLPALLLRRPIVLKSPTSEPLFAPAFVEALIRRLPELSAALAAITWPGGDTVLEAPLLEATERILAYGEAATIDDLEARAPNKVFAYGPKTSLAILGGDVEPSSVAAGLARDIALFDQRGCLSVQSIYTAGDATALATALAEHLQRVAAEWPPGPIDPVVAAGVQQLRSEATMRGLVMPELPLASGTVVVEPQTRFQPAPGLRTVRIHPMTGLAILPEILAEWAGQLQGAALAGVEAWALQAGLEELGISRCTAPGELQNPDATWHNGGVHPFTALTVGTV